jgi:hypothetical protein
MPLFAEEEYMGEWLAWGPWSGLGCTVVSGQALPTRKEALQRTRNGVQALRWDKFQNLLYLSIEKTNAKIYSQS